MSPGLQLMSMSSEGRFSSTSVNPSFEQGEGSGEVVFAPCGTWYLLRMSLWCSAPTPQTPHLHAPLICPGEMLLSKGCILG